MEETRRKIEGEAEGSGKRRHRRRVVKEGARLHAFVMTESGEKVGPSPVHRGKVVPKEPPGCPAHYGNEY